MAAGGGALRRGGQRFLPEIHGPDMARCQEHRHLQGQQQEEIIPEEAVQIG
jgi:hypothetical protein